MAFELKGLAHIGIHVKDMERSVHFYRDILGFTVTDEANPGSRLVFCEKGNCYLELIQPKEHEDRVPGQIDHIAIEVKGIEELRDYLEAQGVKVPEKVGWMPGLLGGVKNFFFEGPDGERLEPFEYTSR